MKQILIFQDLDFQKSRCRFKGWVCTTLFLLLVHFLRVQHNLFRAAWHYNLTIRVTSLELELKNALFCLFLNLCRTAFASIDSTNQRTNPWNFWKKTLRTIWNMNYFHFDFFKKKMVMVFSNKNNLGFHMRYHFFLLYGWFLQNLGKDFIQTNMHTS